MPVLFGLHCTRPMTAGHENRSSLAERLIQSENILARAGIIAMMTESHRHSVARRFTGGAAAAPALASSMNFMDFE